MGLVDRALRELGVAYYVGGSIASSYHGAARSTMDVDIVCELRRDHVETFINLLGNEFYHSCSAILILHGKADTTVPFFNRGEDFSKTLAEGSDSPKIQSFNSVESIFRYVSTRASSNFGG